MVRTLDRCDVLCSTRDCPGLSRLRVWELLQICHHVGDELDGQTFVVHVATEGTPEVSRVASRVGSRAPTRPSAPVESGDLDTGQA